MYESFLTRIYVYHGSNESKVAIGNVKGAIHTWVRYHGGGANGCLHRNSGDPTECKFHLVAIRLVSLRLPRKWSEGTTVLSMSSET